MRIKPVLFLTAILIQILFTATSCSETAEAIVTGGEDWSWKTGAHNTFEGMIDLSEFAGKELTVRMSTDLPYDPEKEQEYLPVFTVVNGARITMMKQNDTTRCSPENENTELRFSGRLQLPEKSHVKQVTFQFVISDGNGIELRTVIASLGGGSEGNSIFYIPLDIYRIILWTAIAAAAVWSSVLIRAYIYRKKIRTGD